MGGARTKLAVMNNFALEEAGNLWYKSRVMARRKRGTFLNKQAPLTLKQRTKRILIWVGAALGVLLLAGIAGYMYLLSWLQGEGFRTYLAGQIQSKTGAAEVSIPENLSVEGRHMTLPACTLREARIIKEFSIHKLHLEVDRLALLRRMLHLNHFSVEEMQLTVQLPDGKAKGGVVSPTPAKEPQAATAAVSIASGEGVMKDFRARSFESHYTDTTINYKDKTFSLNGYQLVALPRPEFGKNAWAIGLENGRIRTPFSWLKESGVKSATLLYRGEGVELSDCKIELAPGNLSAKGVYLQGAGLWKARVDINQANVSRLLNEDWKKRLIGELFGYLDMSGEASKGTWEARGKLRLEKGVLEGLPFLSDLRLHGTMPYRSLQLEKATCQLTYPYSEPEHGLHNAWLWDKIDVRAKDGSLLLRGRVITGADGTLAGMLSVGVPSKLIAELGLSKTPIVNKLFNAPVEAPGYVWLRINLSGTVSEPHEDISVRLATVLPEALPALADKAMDSLHTVIGAFIPKQQQEAEEDVTEEQQEEEAPAKPARQKAGDKVRGLINSGLDMIF